MNWNGSGWVDPRFVNEPNEHERSMFVFFYFTLTKQTIENMNN